jgi:hypothetical protein
MRSSAVSTETAGCWTADPDQGHHASGGGQHFSNRRGFLLTLVDFAVGIRVLETIFLLTSRDTLQKYYTRGQQLLAANPRSVQRSSVAQRRQASPWSLRKPSRTSTSRSS